jgi:N-acetylmuramoyl-L-alanine amidase
MWAPFRAAPIALACAVIAMTVGAAHASGPTIVVDPGHGGSQDGAVGPDGTREKTLTLQISRRLRAELQAKLGASVTLTRDSDADLLLAERVAVANARRPDLFISVHANSMPTVRARNQVNGIETYFLSASASGVDAARIADRENAEGAALVTRPGSDILAFILADLQRTEAHGDSSRLAYAIQKALVGATGATDRGVHQAPFYVLNGLQAPAVLVEVGYISHPEESRRLGDRAYQERLVHGIVEGVRQFLLQTRGAPSASARSAD